MARKLKVVAVAGFRISLNDGSAFWKLVESLKMAINVDLLELTWDTPLKIVKDAIKTADAVISYSWGVATVDNAFQELVKEGTMPRLMLWVIEAGVPRGLAQCLKVSAAKGWQPPDQVVEAVAIQVNSFPVSWPLADNTPQRVTITLGDLPGLDHVSVQDSPDAHRIVLAVLTAEASVLGALPAASPPASPAPSAP